MDTKSCHPIFWGPGFFFGGDFFLGINMSKKELSDLRIWNDRYITVKLKSLIPENGIFDTKNPSAATAGFCFWAPPPPKKKKRQKKTPKKTSQKKIQPPHDPHTSQNKAAKKCPSLGIQVRCTTRWNANTRRMRRWLPRNPESFASVGISCRFGSPKRLGQPTPPNIPSSETRIEYWRSLSKGNQWLK